MGKKGWFYAMKKAVGPSISKIKKEKRSHKSKSNPKNSSSQTEATLANPDLYHCHSIMETEFRVPEHEQIKHVDSITYTTTVADDVVPHAAAEVNCTRSCFLGKTREEISAIKIQTAYRGYMARRAFRSLRVMGRLNLWIQGQAVKRQTTSALMRIQTMCRVQSQVRARKIRMAEANETLQRQLIQKRKKALEKQAFDLSPKSKEQVEASLKSKKEAAERREKALAYAYSRQQAWRNAHKTAVVDPNHLCWGWSWSSRWDAIRPSETAGTTSNGGAMVRRQSPPSKPAISSGQRLIRSPNSRSPRLQISRQQKPVTTRINTGCLVGLANKRHLVMSSTFTGAPRIMVR